MISATLLAELKRHEGYRKHMYKCTAGYNTIGYGLNLDAGVDEELASVILEFLCNRIELELEKKYDWYRNLSQARKEVIINMVYNLGIDGFDKFKNTIYLIKNSRHEEAAQEMLKSKWAEQVGNRAKALSEKFKKG